MGLALIGLHRFGSQGEVVYMTLISAHKGTAYFESTSYYTARPWSIGTNVRKGASHGLIVSSSDFRLFAEQSGRQIASPY